MEPAIKIAILLPSMGVGGAERLVLEELSFLKTDPRFDFEVHLVFEKGKFFDELSELGVKLHVWNAPNKSLRMLKTYWDISRHLRRTHCDILHCHLLNEMGPLFGKLAGIRVVTTVHNDVKYSLLEKKAIGISDLVLGCGAQVMRNIQSFLPASKALQLDNSIRQPQKSKVSRRLLCEKYSIDPEAPIVLSLGRLTRAKGYDDLIDAFSIVTSQIPSAILLIAGDGPDRKILQDKICSTQMEDKIKLLGIISEVNDLYEISTLYVNSSRWEGLPMTLLEALAHKKAIVATSVGGNPEVVQDGINGILVPSDSPDKIAYAIIRILEDADYREVASDASLDLFTNRYTIERHCETLAWCYTRLLQT